jgi:hypothetical protein
MLRLWDILTRELRVRRTCGHDEILRTTVLACEHSFETSLDDLRRLLARCPTCGRQDEPRLLVGLKSRDEPDGADEDPFGLNVPFS